MTLSSAARNLLVGLAGIWLFSLVQWQSHLSSIVTWVLSIGWVVLVLALVYIIGKEMSPVHNVTALLIVCFLVLFVQLNRIQVLQANAIADVPGNNRTTDRDFGGKRGRILSSDRQVVAMSEAIEDSERFDYRRLYPHGELYAHSVGYVSLTLGMTGLERQYNSKLTSENNDLILSIDHRLQQVAREALKDPNTGEDRPGSVVALNPKTGDVKALWSYPSYNPQPLSSFSSKEVNEAINELEGETDHSARKCSDTPRCAKAYQDRTVPGSTFKLVVAAGALYRVPSIRPTHPVFPSVRSYRLPDGNGRISNYGGSVCGGNIVDLVRRSCNAGFAQIAVEDLGPEAMVEQAEAFGFNHKIPLDVPASSVVASFYPTDFGNYRGDARGYRLFDQSNKLGQTAIGQSDVQATPLNMAMIAAAIANDGDMMIPRLVYGWQDQLDPADPTDQSPQVRGPQPKRWLEPVSSTVARDLRSAMYQVVRNGTGKSVAVAGLDVGAKTGTADIKDKVHAWMVGFAGPQGSDPDIAFAVVVENQAGQAGVTGGKVAGPVAKALIQGFYSPIDENEN